MNKKKRILIIDFAETPTHADTLYTQLQFLSECEVYGYFHQSYEKHIPQADCLKEKFFYSKERGFRSDWNAVKGAIALVKSVKPQVVYLNMGQGNRVRLFALRMIFSRLKLIATHHNPQKLIDSSSQRIISLKVKKYFVLANFIKQEVLKRAPSSLAIESYYPMFFEEREQLAAKLKNDFELLQTRKDSKIRIGILGGLEQSRRDYEGLYKALLALGDRVPSNLEFAFLGDSSHRDAQEIKHKFLSLPCRSQFEFNEGFLSYEELFERVRKVDVIMPLLHPSLVYFDEYKDFKITGAYLWGLCYRKPFIFEKNLNHMSDFKDISIYYDSNNFSEALLELSEGLEKIRELTQTMYNKPDLSFEYQKEKYLRFLGLDLNSSKRNHI